MKHRHRLASWWSLLILLVGIPLTAFGDDDDKPLPRQIGSPPPPAATGTGFSFGSYGRVGIGIDARGHTGYDVNVISHGSRLELPPYLELDLYYGGQIGNSDARWRVILAPAFDGDIFHFTGNFASRFGVRNAYIETDGLGTRGLNIWAGSRQLRGDDIYLLNYWPLDNLNTVGAGASYYRDKLYLQIHGGLNRLDDDTQYDTIALPARGLGPPVQSLTTDRPRSIGSFKATYYLGPKDVPGGPRCPCTARFIFSPTGQRVFLPQQRTEKLPADNGWVGGLQLGGWLRPFTFINLWFRAAGGLGALGDLTPQRGFDLQRRTAGTREFLGALSLNYETRWIGVQGAAFIRRYRDASPGSYQRDNYLEGILIARPHIYLSKYFQVATEFSYQQRQYGGFDPAANRRLTPQVFRASVLPIVAPFGRGTYSRPIIYGVVTYSRLSEDARVALFDPTDVRYSSKNVLYLGLGAEWWFNSSYR